MIGKGQLILNRYRPLAEAGAGGFGTVHLAWDTRIQRRVAIKCIELDDAELARAALPGAEVVDAGTSSPLPWEDDDDFRARAAAREERSPRKAMREEGASIDLLEDEPPLRFLAHLPGLDEARTAAMLSDASIVTVYDFEVQDSTAYLIMEYVEGITLTRLLRSYGDRLTLDIVAAVFLSVAHALEVAHANQVLHLDIKPDNVLVNRQGQVKVTDFGLATLADASGYGTAGGGTIGYMPLEQMRQESLDARCDEWALAALTYEMLAGDNPFRAPDMARAEAAIEDAELVLPSLCWEELDEAADDVVFYALDPDRDERYASVADFAEELEPFLGDPKRGTRELASLLGQDDDAQPPEEEQAPPAPRLALRERLSARHRRAAAHAVGALGSGLLAYAALSALPQTSGFDKPLFWGVLALVAIAGLLWPQLGSLLACFSFSAALIASGAPAAGVVLLAATALWWYLAGRLSRIDANAALTAPLAGALWCNQLTPLVAGLCLPPARAFGSLAFSALLSIMLAACGSHSLLSWDAFAFGGPLDGPGMQAGLGMLLSQPALWCVVLSWFAATGLLVLFRRRPSRAFAVTGTLAAGACLVAGVCLAAWLASGGVTAAPSVGNLAFTLIPFALALFASTLVPDAPIEGEVDD